MVISAGQLESAIYQAIEAYNDDNSEHPSVVRENLKNIRDDIDKRIAKLDEYIAEITEQKTEYNSKQV